MQISFHGADRSVTGSCHRLECNDVQLLVDCGLYQGSRALAEDNAGDFGFDPARIDYVVLTHAHLDHCGRLPLLVKRGFRGEILATAATRDLARVVLSDSAHLQEEEAERSYTRSHGNREHAPPLYTMADAENALARFGRTLRYGERLEVCAGVGVTAYDAGHILGSASLYFELVEGARRRTVVLSGDLGTGGRPLLNDPVPPPHADVVVMETTYGDRLHRPLPQTLEEFYGAVSQTHARGGNVVIPTFALERAQELLYYLRLGVSGGALPASLTVFLDSPMAIIATEAFRAHPEAVAAPVAQMLARGDDPFAVDGLHLTRDGAASRAINAISGGAVIMAGSGMCTGGRVMHHLQHNLARDAASVIFVGYAAVGTPARRIIDGAKTLRLFGEEIPVRARVYTINGFSAHADRDELLAWHRAVAPGRTFLVHGDEDVMRKFAALLGTANVQMPAADQAYEL